MTVKAPPAAPERKARCRMRNRLDDRCPNEVIDADPKAPQVCPRHALEAAQLLEASGVIKIHVTGRKAS